MEENKRIERLIPDFLLRDKNGYALAKGMEAMLRAMDRVTEAGIAQLADVSQMEEWRLDEMAWEMNVLWYDYGADIDVKRSMISGAEEYFNRLGTPYAVERAINDVYGVGRIEEWFDYGGEPWHYRVYTSNASALAEKRERFLKLLGVVNRQSCVLDNIYYIGAEGSAGVQAVTAVTGMMGVIEMTAKRY